jgi:hypothetical protein
MVKEAAAAAATPLQLRCDAGVFFFVIDTVPLLNFFLSQPCFFLWR